MAAPHDNNNALFNESQSDNGDDPSRARTVTGQQSLREKMQKDIEDFLKAGGKIETVSASATGDIESKGSYEYGKRSI
jgi:hypothetical protein